MLEYCASHMCGHALGVQCPHSQLIAVAGEVWYWFECALHTGWLSSTMAGAVWGRCGSLIVSYVTMDTRGEGWEVQYSPYHV